MELLYLSKKDVEEINLSMEEIIDAVEKAFISKSEGNFEMPPKPGVHPGKDAFIHAMPAYLPEIKYAGLKWVSGFPENNKRGLPYISGLFILNDTETGFPVSVMDCTWITGKRTGAATAVAAKFLARMDSEKVGILGCGVQGRTNLEALNIVLKNIKKVYAYDINRENLSKYIEDMRGIYKFDIIPVDSPEKAVIGMDVVVTAGPILKTPSPTIDKEWFEKGCFASAIDFDSYWKPDAMKLADKFVTDDIKQLNYYKSIGYFKNLPEKIIDLGDIVAGKVNGREEPYERTMTMNLGLAIEDVATASLIYRKAVELNKGVKLPL
ncbi:ornithine cyclodeaminase family protein [candidate division KSB1 bacterium]|nr:MAG: ornithine cyclodeaminase family protein [candidate division KSB1 bacterium]